MYPFIGPPLDCEITLENVPGTNQYSANTVKFLAQGNNENR